MNRDQLLQAATKHIRNGDDAQTDYDYRSMHYLAAIAKLLLAQSLIAVGPQPDAPASPGWTDSSGTPEGPAR